MIGFGPPDAARVSAEDIGETLRGAGFADVDIQYALESFSVVTATR